VVWPKLWPKPQEIDGPTQKLLLKFDVDIRNLQPVKNTAMNRRLLLSYRIFAHRRSKDVTPMFEYKPDSQNGICVNQETPAVQAGNVAELRAARRCACSARLPLYHGRPLGPLRSPRIAQYLLTLLVLRHRTKSSVPGWPPLSARQRRESGPLQSQPQSYQPPARPGQ